MMDEVCVMAFGEDLGYWGIDELRSLEATRLNICFVHPIYRFLFLVTFVDKVTKILCNLCLHFARQDGQDGKN